MASKHKKYVFRGVDVKTNRLYRQEGTASDCRNVLLDHSRNLIKRPDFDTITPPRGVDGEVDDFVDKLPFHAVIVDMIPYESYFVLVTLINIGTPPLNNRYVNKFYKWFPESNTVEFIPFNQETSVTTTEGQIREGAMVNLDGKCHYVNQENILYIVGHNPATNAQDFTYDKIAALNDLTSVHAFDGKVITRAGCPQTLVDTTTDIGSQSATNNEYIRLVPFKIDDKGRWTFGNYSTHLSNYTLTGPAYMQKFNIPASNYTYAYEHQVYFVPNSSQNMLSTDSAALRTSNCVIGNTGDPNRGASIGVGQYLYSVKRFDSFTPAGPTPTFGSVRFEIYRATVEAFTLGTPDTVTLTEFKMYNSDTGQWDDSTDFRLTSNTPVSNILMAAYGSDEFAYGYDFRLLLAYATDGALDLLSNYPTTKGSSTLNSVSYNTELLFIQEAFSDMYDEETVKGVPPKANSITNYASAILLTDHENLYFSDLSVGGTIEVFTPFDNFPVGSSKRGPIKGVFANESFLTVFREQEAYYISGNIFLQNYRVQSYYSTRIGLSDPRGMLELNGAGIFPSSRGFYVCSQGAQMEEISDSMDPIFTDNVLDLQVDMSKTKALIDYKNEDAWFLVKSASLGWVIFVFNYYHKEWLLLDGIDGQGGFDILNDKIYYSDGEKIYEQNGSRVDSDAYYVSNFETVGEPSLYKKFIQALVFCTDMINTGTLYIKNYVNWDYSVPLTDEQETIGGDKKLVTRRFNPKRSLCSAIRVESPSGSEMKLDGYEYEFAMDVSAYKNED